MVKKKKVSKKKWSPKKSVKTKKCVEKKMWKNKKTDFGCKTGGVFSQWQDMLVWKHDMDVRFGEFLATSKAQTAAIDELRTMFSRITAKAKHGDEGSPSIGTSALEHGALPHQPEPSTKETAQVLPPAVGATTWMVSGRPTTTAVHSPLLPTLAKNTEAESALQPIGNTTKEGAGLQDANLPADPESVANDETPLPQRNISAKVLYAPKKKGTSSKECTEEHALDEDDGMLALRSGGPSTANTEGSPNEEADGVDSNVAPLTKSFSPGTAGDVPQSDEAAVIATEPTQKKTKRSVKSPRKVLSPPGVAPTTSREVRPFRASQLFSVFPEFDSKLVVLNVHGTLLDSSMLNNPNPNPQIKTNLKTESRRIVFRPCLKFFLQQCFQSFNVAFWGSGSREHMHDVSSAMLEGLKGVKVEPLFVWSGTVHGNSNVAHGNTRELGKQLELVYASFPRFCAANTIIIDSKVGRVERNPDANVIMSTPFYVKWLITLADDKQFLKRYLWPLLEAFHKCKNVADFRSKFPEFVNETPSQMMERRRTGHAYDFLDLLEGEGTSIPLG